MMLWASALPSEGRLGPRGGTCSGRSTASVSLNCPDQLQGRSEKGDSRTSVIPACGRAKNYLDRTTRHVPRVGLAAQTLQLGRCLTSAAIEDLVIDLEDVETDYASIKAFRKSASEFATYITNNASMIPNYAERRRYGERVSTGFVESTVNTVVGKRFGKRQQMRWSKRGAHLMLQTRTRVLDGTLRTKFEQ